MRPHLHSALSDSKAKPARDVAGRRRLDHHVFTGSYCSDLEACSGAVPIAVVSVMARGRRRDAVRGLDGVVDVVGQRRHAGSMTVTASRLPTRILSSR